MSTTTDKSTTAAKRAPVTTTSATPTLHYTPYARLTPSTFAPELQHKTVLITGGNRGIGAAVATSFARAGVKRLVLVARDVSKLGDVCTSLSRAFPETAISTHAVDLASPTSIAALFAALSEAHIVPDMLVNNASVLTDPTPLIDADLDEYWNVFEVNVRGTLHMTQAFLRLRRAAAAAATEKDGTAKEGEGEASPAVVLTMTSGGAFNIQNPGLSSYSASKAAQLRVSEVLQGEFPGAGGSEDVRFTTLAPGVVETEMMVKSRVGTWLKVPRTELQLVGDFTVWAATREAGFLAGRFAAVMWDVDELVGRREEVQRRNALRSWVSGVDFVVEV